MRRSILLMLLPIATVGLSTSTQAQTPPALAASPPVADDTWHWIEVEPARSSATGWVTVTGTGTVRITGSRFHADLQVDSGQVGADITLEGRIVNGRIQANETLLNTDAEPAPVHGALRREPYADHFIEERIAIRGGQSGDASFLGLFRRVAR